MLPSLRPKVIALRCIQIDQIEACQMVIQTAHNLYVDVQLKKMCYSIWIELYPETCATKELEPLKVHYFSRIVEEDSSWLRILPILTPCMQTSLCIRLNFLRSMIQSCFCIT
ncbi:hypothetical protein VNO77_44301 [Canavalia gladiata]|uniref:Uncharacterized protein n=1 Tax=Canavalia gladiata TaxID=3824 RepID=A0AAN9JYP2_CANGL